MIRGTGFADFVQVMYGNRPPRWDDTLTGDDRLRCIINVLTRIRFCRADGTMEFETKSSAAEPPAGLRALVRAAGASDGGHAGGLRALEHPGPDRPPRPALARYRLRVGWLPERSAGRWRTA